MALDVFSLPRPRHRPLECGVDLAPGALRAPTAEPADARGMYTRPVSQGRAWAPGMRPRARPTPPPPFPPPPPTSARLRPEGRQGVRARALACAEAAALAAFLAALLGEQNVAASYATRRRTTRCSAAGSGVGASAQGWASRPLTHLIARGARVLWIDWYDKTLRFDESDAWRS